MLQHWEEWRDSPMVPDCTSVGPHGLKAFRLSSAEEHTANGMGSLERVQDQTPGLLEFKLRRCCELLQKIDRMAGKSQQCPCPSCVLSQMLETTHRWCPAAAVVQPQRAVPGSFDGAVNWSPWWWSGGPRPELHCPAPSPQSEGCLWPSACVRRPVIQKRGSSLAINGPQVPSRSVPVVSCRW